MRAVILGGTGAIGGATALRLAEAGWSVDITSTGSLPLPAELQRPDIRHHLLHRADDAGHRALMDDGADLLVDTLSYSAEDAESLVSLMTNVTSGVVISSRAVYVDSRRRSLNSDPRAHFDRPLMEGDQTVSPAERGEKPFTRDGYARGKRAVELTCLASGLPITILRAAKVHGRWTRQSRTEWLITNMLECPAALYLAHLDAVDHLSAATNVAALIETAAARPGARILNAGDPDLPTAREIVGRIGELVGFKGSIQDAHPRTDDEFTPQPWSMNMQLDTTASRGLGYRPVASGLELLGEEVEWLLSPTSPRPR